MALEVLNFAPANPPATPLWSVIVRPSELEIPSKTYECDDTVMWDHAHLQWMTEFVAAWRLADRGGPVWGFTYRQLTMECASFAYELGLT